MALDANKIARMWVNLGGDPRYATVMAKIAKRESGFNPKAQNLTYPDHSIGLFQINQLAHKGTYGSDQKLMRPRANVKAAIAIFNASKNAGQDPLKPWSTYNPATDIKLIGKGAPAPAASGGATGSRTKVTRTPGIDNSALRRSLIADFVAQGGPDNENALLSLATSLPEAKDVPGRTVRKTVQSQSAVKGPGGTSTGKGSFKITGPTPGRLTAPLVSFAKKVASIYGRPLTGSDGTGHSKMTVDGNVSDHWSGNATDIPASGQTLINMGRAALIAAGMPKAQAMKQTGGLFNVNGHQVIFNTQSGGDHTDHLHISV